ncbi:helix-turn-helix domain-containing protein [Ekhidna sp.]
MYKLTGISGRKYEVLIPDNRGELFIPLEASVEYYRIGNLKKLTFKRNNCYFSIPPRRGASIQIKENHSLLLIKINPLLTSKITQELSEFSRGIYTLDLSKRNRTILINSVVKNDVNKVNDVLNEVLKTSANCSSYNSTVFSSIEQIRKTYGRTSIKDIYSSLNVSKSKLEHDFNKEVGLTPKEFCKIEKINFFIKSYLKQPNQTLTKLTYQCGYYDQSHLVKDFRYFLDLSPKKYLTQLR